MDFDKEAREICAPLLSPEPHPFQSEWSDIHSMCTCDLLTNIERALRRAFLAGRESMRESASKEVPTNWCHDLLSGPNSSKLPLSQQGVEKLLLGVKNNIRSLPLLEEPNKEVAG